MRKLQLLFDEELDPPVRVLQDLKVPKVPKVDLSLMMGTPVMIEGEPIGVLANFQVSDSREVSRVHAIGAPDQFYAIPMRQTIEVNVQSMVVDFDALDRAVQGTLRERLDSTEVVLRSREVQHARLEPGLINHRLLYEVIRPGPVRSMSMGCQVEHATCSICEQSHRTRDHPEDI